MICDDEILPPPIFKDDTETEGWLGDRFCGNNKMSYGQGYGVNGYDYDYGGFGGGDFISEDEENGISTTGP